jgi:hypothetical protein
MLCSPPGRTPRRDTAAVRSTFAHVDPRIGRQLTGHLHHRRCRVDAGQGVHGRAAPSQTRNRYPVPHPTSKIRLGVDAADSAIEATRCATAWWNRPSQPWS